MLCWLEGHAGPKPPPSPGATEYIIYRKKQHQLADIYLFSLNYVFEMYFTSQKRLWQELHRNLTPPFALICSQRPLKISAQNIRLHSFFFFYWLSEVEESKHFIK